MEILVKKALPEDFEIITKVGHDTFYETWREYNTPEDMATYLKKAFDPKAILNDLTDPTNTFLTASINGNVIGYAKMRRDRTYDEFKNDPAIEIERVYVFKEFQSKKVGKMLMDECLKIALKEKFVWIWLGVNIDNHKAINFYKAYGFTIFGEKGFQLGDAVDTDYLMKKQVKESEMK
jgi:diamine N-acetyltransferase